jgi:hypothetical protein
MTPIQYRDPETDEILERTYEDSTPEIGQTVTLDTFGECQVLYRWRTHPTACVVYVQRAKTLA